MFLVFADRSIKFFVKYDDNFFLNFDRGDISSNYVLNNFAQLDRHFT